MAFPCKQSIEPTGTTTTSTIAFSLMTPLPYLLLNRIMIKLSKTTAVALLIAFSGSAAWSLAVEFQSKTIDLGVVVSDIDRSVQFYTEALGMKEVPGFSVPGDFARQAGLTDGKPLEVRVLVLGEGPGATKLKLMEIAGTPNRPANDQFIHSQLGFRYLTMGITDTDAAVAQLQKAGVKPLANSPVALPPPLPQNIFVTLIRDPDGNLIELVGPKLVGPNSERPDQQ